MNMVLMHYGMIGIFMNILEPTQTRNYDVQDDILEDFLRGMGSRVIRLKTGLWESMGSRVFQPVKINGPMELSESEIKQLWDHGSFFLRYPVRTDSMGVPSFIHLLDDKDYDLDKVPSSQRRRDIRRSFKLCCVEQVSIKDILKSGLDLIPDTMLRQGRPWEPWVTQWWKKYFELASENPLFEAWAAFEGNRLGAYRIDLIYRGGCLAQVIFNRAESLRMKVMDAMTFVSTKEVIKRPEIEFILLGIRGRFADVPTLDRFKESMGFKRLEIKERVEASPKFRLMFRSDSVCWIIGSLLKYYKKSYSTDALGWAIKSLQDQR